MANYTCTTNMTLEACIAAGPMNSGDDLTINAGATVTCDRTPSILMGRITINDGKLLVDGANIGTGNMINFVGNYQEYIIVYGQGELDVDGKWYSIGTTDGTNSQTFNLATYYDTSFCVDVVPMIQVETGRRINFDNTTGTAPEVDDFVFKASDHGVYGRIIEVQPTYLIVRWLIGTLVDDDAIEVQKVVDNNGPDMQISWTADVNHASGDILESGVYQEFGNSRANGISYISYYNHGVGGFVFDNQYQSTTLTMGTAAGATGGFVPPSGCDVRIPNVHFSTSNTTNYATNTTYHDGTAVETNWYDLNTSNAGAVDLSICNFGVAYFASAYASSYDGEYVGSQVCTGSSSAGSKTTYDHCVVVPDAVNRAIGSSYIFSTSDLLKGADVTNCMKVTSERNRFYLGALSSYDINFEGCIGTSPGAALWNTHSNYIYHFNRVAGLTIKNNIAVSFDAGHGPMLISDCDDVEVDNFMFSSTQDETIQAGEFNGLSIGYCTNARVCGIFVIGNGVPGNAVFSAGDCVNFKLYCMGMIDDKIALGTTDCEQVIYFAGICDNVEMARIWCTEGILNYAIFNSLAIQQNISVMNCSRRYDSSCMPLGGDYVNCKGLHCSSGNIGNVWNGLYTSYAAGYGSHWHDVFRSDTTGAIALVFTPKTTKTDAVYTINAGAPKFFKDGDLDMVSGDRITFEMQYFARGHTGFSGVTTFTLGQSTDGTDAWGANITKEFQYDVGSGYNGSWLDLTTAANLTGISVNPAIGVKLKVRLTATGTVSNICGMFIHTTTTLTAQKANFYTIDLDDCDVVLNGIVSGSRYWIYDEDLGEELAEGTATTDPVTETVRVKVGTNLLIRVRKSSAPTKYYPFTTKAISNNNDVNVAIIQTEDIIAT